MCTFVLLELKFEARVGRRIGGNKPSPPGHFSKLTGTAKSKFDVHV